MNFVNVTDLSNFLVIALIRIASWFPVSNLRSYLIGGIAVTANRLSRKNKAVKRRIVSKIFGNTLTESQQQQIVTDTFYTFWRERLALLPSRAERAALSRAGIQGVEHLQNALKAGRGVILWESATFGRRVVAKQILHARGYTLHQVHAEHHLSRSMTWVSQHIIGRFFEKSTRRYIKEIIYLPDSESLTFTRTLLNRLHQNAILCIAGDGKQGKNLITLDFLGFPDTFATGMVSLAKLSGATILPIFCNSDKDSDPSVVIESPIQIQADHEREQTLEDSVSQFVRLLEAYIKRYPAEYRGWHYLDRLMSENIDK